MNTSRRSFIAGASAAVAAASVAASAAFADESPEIAWDYEADVVVVGSGCSGLPAALKAAEGGASVLVVEGQFDCGGQFAVSAGQLHLGAGNSDQLDYGIEDSADMWFTDHTSCMTAEGRWNDWEVTRAVADNMVDTYESILAWGVKVKNNWGNSGATNNYTLEPDTIFTFADSIEREENVDSSDWDGINAAWDNPYGITPQAGVGYTRPLEKTAREMGVQFLLNHYLTEIYRDGTDGDVLGVSAAYKPILINGEVPASLMSDGNIESTEDVNIRAHKAVILCTGGGTNNVAYRRMFDPRLDEEYNCVGMPWGIKDGSGELAALRIGASLGCCGQQTVPFKANYSKQNVMGTWYNGNVDWSPDCTIAPLLGTCGVRPSSLKNIMQVRMDGKRFYREDCTLADFEYADQVFAGIETTDENGNLYRISTCVWSIMDQNTVDEMGWTMEPPWIDFDGDYAYKADTIEELAEMIKDPFHPEISIDPAVLANTLARYNELAEGGVDKDFGKTMDDASPITEPPFYALWTNACTHDSKAGLRINGKCQVLDMELNPIPRLYAAGECASGIFQHGSGGCAPMGYIAGKEAAALD